MADNDPIVLVVDDVEDNLDLLEFALKRKPLQMLRATSGKECIELATTKHPDIILLDIQMPEMDGFETLKRLRAQALTAKIPVIFLTAQRKDPESIEKGLLLGADEYLTKPIDTDELLIRTRTLVRLSQIQQELERTKADFLAMLIHDLRSPMAGVREVIKLVLEVQAMEKTLETDFLEMLNSSIDSIERMLALINDFLEFSKFEAGKMTLHKSVQDINAIVVSACKRMDIQFRQKTVTISTELAPALPTIAVDAMKIGQVLENLLSNSLKFTASGGTVTVSTNLKTVRTVNEAQNDFIEVSVHDTGIGIAANELPSLFERYKQVSQPGKIVQRGTGLGLTICKLAVEAHGGMIEVESEVGKYSIFRFTLPII